MKKFLLAIVAAVSLFLLWGFYLTSTDPLYEEREHARRVLDRCDSEWKDELKPMDQRRFIREVCDRKRDEFRKKYNREP